VYSNARMDDLFPRSYSFQAPAPSYPWENDLFGPVDTEGEPLFANHPPGPPPPPPPAADLAALIQAAIAAARDGGPPPPDFAALIAAAFAAHAAHAANGGGGGGGAPAPATVDMAPFAEVLRPALDNLIFQFRGMTAGITGGYEEVARTIVRLSDALDNNNTTLGELTTLLPYLRGS
jgi:hypothetical protein